VVGKLGCERVVYIVASVFNQSCSLGTKPFDLVMMEVLLSDCGSTEPPLRTSSLMVTERIHSASLSIIYLSEVKSSGAAIEMAIFWKAMRAQA
jgi:hypothetical protein